MGIRDKDALDPVSAKSIHAVVIGHPLSIDQPITNVANAKRAKGFLYCWKISVRSVAVV
jgi:hypothetical protein